MSRRSKILISLAVLVSLIWIVGFIAIDGSSWRQVADDQTEDLYFQCMDQKKDPLTCNDEQDQNRRDLYGGIQWGGITLLAVAPVVVIWAAGLAIWLVRRKLKAKSV
jgi:hypothetical protein